MCRRRRCVNREWSIKRMNLGTWLAMALEMWSEMLCIQTDKRFEDTTQVKKDVEGIQVREGGGKTVTSRILLFYPLLFGDMSCLTLDPTSLPSYFSFSNTHTFHEGLVTRALVSSWSDQRGQIDKSRGRRKLSVRTNLLFNFSVNPWSWVTDWEGRIIE